MDIDMDIRTKYGSNAYGSNASSLASALANGTAAAKQRMATTAMDSFIAMVGREPSRMVCVLCCCMCCCVLC